MEAYEEDSFHIETLEISDASLDFGHGELLLKDQSPKRTNKKSLVKKTPPRQQEKKFFTRRISDLREKDGGKVASGQSTPEDEYASPFDFSTKAVYENYLFLMPDNPHSHGDEIQLCDDDDGQKLQSYSQKLPDEHTYDNRDSAYSTPDPTQDGDPLYQDPTELQDEQEKEEIRAELQKTEEEIKTLKQVLASKERAAADLKRRLGITPLKEFKDEASKTWKNVQSSQAYQKTNEKFVEWKEKMESSETYKKTSETLSVAGQKTAQASAAAWQSMSRKLGEMKNSQSFKSFEEKVGSTVSNLKSKVTSPREPKPTFEDVLNSTANADKQDDSQNAPPLPEEKVPL
ncbi:PREDICTED: tumor protein D54-like isoform X6 [Branchiostoma belcheri]|uniref:Tumor protein D54-like isoform X6 n=1 Tax=Branchiostoma belcheri TaxID=7741 RepID=A0A6P4ZXK1_BRABE|nr:PREDICTED: tumor protein D54-like isoform X6 [Branchiostoma belcheri]